MKNEKFRNVRFEKVKYIGDELIVEYWHKNYKKKLTLKNVKSAKTVLWTFPYYDSLLNKMGLEEGFCNMVNKSYKYNELYLIDGGYIRIIIKFKDK